ncbi:MAG: hypothetical protein AB7G39_08045 [Alphaproteobacteria bacterium]
MRRNKRSGLAVLLGAMLLTGGPALAASPRDEVDRDYGACMRRARVDPMQAFESAQIWQGQGGGYPARHCEAVALLGLGHFEDAAIRLQALAADLPGDAPPAQRAELLAQAGQAWMRADRMAAAEKAQTAALDLLAGQPRAAVEIRIDRAMLRALGGRYAPAVEDLEAALAASPDNVAALTMRASGLRHLGRTAEAMADLNHALRLDSVNPEALLERGILKHQAGDLAGARADWLRLIQQSEGTPAADAAQRNLEAMDVKAR